MPYFVFGSQLGWPFLEYTDVNLGLLLGEPRGLSPLSTPFPPERALRNHIMPKCPSLCRLPSGQAGVGPAAGLSGVCGHPAGRVGQ